MGGLWVDYDLMSTVPGLFVIGEANFSDHGANRLGASALMQGLADGYFILPCTLAGYLAGAALPPVARGRCGRQAALGAVRRAAAPRCWPARDAARRATSTARSGGCSGRRAGSSAHRAGLAKAIDEIAALREAFCEDLTVPGHRGELNQELERAGRVADFLELGELMCRDALAREESCGCHFRVEHADVRTARRARDDDAFAHVAVWAPGGAGHDPQRLIEPLSFETLAPRERCYR